MDKPTSLNNRQKQQALAKKLAQETAIQLSPFAVLALVCLAAV